MQARQVDLSVVRHRAQPGAHPSKVLWPGTDARGPFVGVEGVVGVGVVGVVGRVGDVVAGGVGVVVGVAVPGL